MSANYSRPLEVWAGGYSNNLLQISVSVNELPGNESVNVHIAVIIHLDMSPSPAFWGFYHKLFVLKFALL